MPVPGGVPACRRRGAPPTGHGTVTPIGDTSGMMSKRSKPAERFAGCPAPSGPSWLALATALVVLSGCTAISSEPMPPLPAAPAAWTQPAANMPMGSGAADQSSIGPGSRLADWWRQFNDPLLEALVAAALTDSPDLRAASARLAQARAQRGIAAAGLVPSVDLGASTRASAARGSDTSRSYSLGLDARWELDLFGGLRSAVDAAQAELEASAAELGSVQASLAAEVALAYVDLRSLQSRLDVAQRNLEAQLETLQLTRWRAQAGLVGALDVEQARAIVEQTRAQLPVLRTSLGQARHRLSVLTGRPPGAWDAQLASPGPIPAAPTSIALGIPAETLGQRPDVLAAERSLAAATARVGQARAARYPGLTLSGSLGLDALSLAGLTSGGATTRSLAASLAATLFDGGRLRRTVELRTGAQAQALASYEATMLAALEEVENALLAVAGNRERRLALEQAADAARNAALLARQRYASGLTDFQSVLDSARTVLSAEDSLAVNEADGAISMVRLYKALGGGWAVAQ